MEWFFIYGNIIGFGVGDVIDGGLVYVVGGVVGR